MIPTSTGIQGPLLLGKDDGVDDLLGRSSSESTPPLDGSALGTRLGPGPSDGQTEGFLVG